jgi:hypothetical protein
MFVDMAWYSGLPVLVRLEGNYPERSVYDAMESEKATAHNNISVDRIRGTYGHVHLCP